MSELQEQSYGLESVERAAGYIPADVPMPQAEESQGDISIQETELRDTAKEISKARNERQRELETRPFDSTVEVRDTSGHKLPEEQTLTAEEAAYLVTGAREQQGNQAELDDRAALAAEIDALRSGTAYEPQVQQQPIEQQQTWEQPQPAQQAPLTEQQRMARVLEENPQLLAGMQATIEQEQARYANAVHQNAQAAMAHTLASFAELNGITDVNQLAGALHAVRSQDPARAASITEHIARTRQFVEESQRVAAVQEQQQSARVQQWIHQYNVNMHRQFAAHDQAYDQWSRNQGTSPDQQKAITQEVFDEFARNGWTRDQVAHAYNNDPAMRSLTGQQQLHQAAAYRLQQRSMANVRRNKLDRSPPHVMRPGSPEHFVRDSDQHHYEKQLFKRIDESKGSDAAKAGAALIQARRNAARR